MDLFVYSDESGVFDKLHNDIFVYGGLIFSGRKEKDDWSRKYLAAESAIRTNKYNRNDELKACKITNKEKGKLFRSLNGALKFGVVINQKSVLDRIFLSRKDKQRYLDYAYKIGLKKALQRLIGDGILTASEIANIHVFNDEHSTATNGRYELREALEQEFKLGTYNFTYDRYFPPIFSTLEGIDLTFCNSSTTTLIRAADIVANKIYFDALNGKIEQLDKVYISTLP